MEARPETGLSLAGQGSVEKLIHNTDQQQADKQSFHGSPLGNPKERIDPPRFYPLPKPGSKLAEARA